MRETEWQYRDSLPDMIRVLSSHDVSKRKALLWNIAVCLRWRGHLDDAVLDVLADAERHADGERPLPDEWELVDRVQQLKGQHGDTHSSHTAFHRRMAVGAVEAAIWPREMFGVGGYMTGIETDEADQKCRLLRDVFGNPFRPVAFAPAWRSEAAVALSRTAYDTRNFTLLPILADALEEAGCNHPDVLTHCRDPNGVHVRGCWVVDGVLGKT